MKVVLTTSGRFHTFALARELHAHRALHAIVTGFPWSKVKREALPRKLVKTFSLLTLLRFGLERIGLSNRQTTAFIDELRFKAIDRYSKHWALQADIFMGLSGSGLHTGQAVKRRGGIYICDRGSTHILFQKRILEEEAHRFGGTPPVIPQGVIRRELAEYKAADAITVPSEFVRRTFIEQGVSPEKVHKISYGSNIQAFSPSQTPSPTSFDVLFVGSISLRKGVPYLLEAFKQLVHPGKTLTFVGMATADMAVIRPLVPEGVRFLGHVPNAKLKDIMSASHVMVLPSVEEGLALVLGEALASGCPVIATENTGAGDLFTDGVEGFITPTRDVAALTARLQQMADDPDLRSRMALAARRRLTTLGGWSNYGQEMMALYERLLSRAQDQGAINRSGERVHKGHPK